MACAPWWKGTRGEWYVVAQLLLLLLIAVGPRRWHGWPPWPFPQGPIVTIAGALLLLAGLVLGLAGIARIGRALTPLPYPADNAVLRETGPYRVVRHPMYGGVLIAAVGWVLLCRGWLTLAYVLAALVFLELKVRREERWLVERFPAYRDYRRRVRKFIPFLH